MKKENITEIINETQDKIREISKLSSDIFHNLNKIAALTMPEPNEASNKPLFEGIVDIDKSPLFDKEPNPDELPF